MRFISSGDPALLRDTQNQRALVRYRCPPAANAKVYLGEDLEFQRGWLLDLSREGMGILLPRDVPPDTQVSIQLRKGGRPFEIIAHVAHSTFQSQGEWKVGLRLQRPLDPEEMEEILN